MEFKIGDTHKILKHPSIVKMHILAIIDENYIVYKWYGKHKQWWHYCIEHKDVLDNDIERTKEK